MSWSMTRRRSDLSAAPHIVRRLSLGERVLKAE